VKRFYVQEDNSFTNQNYTFQTSCPHHYSTGIFSPRPTEIILSAFKGCVPSRSVSLSMDIVIKLCEKTLSTMNQEV